MGAINEILPKATGVGKVDPNSGGTGEIFNSYEDYMANKATGEYSHAEGCYNEAKGNYSHAEGYLTIASGNNAHAEGDGARANGYCSHAEGNSLANGRHSHAEGYSNSAMGDSSHAEGGQSDANGEYSHAEGFRTKTFSFAEHAEGTYNKSYDSEVDSTRVIHSVGIGSQENNRKNAHEIKFNGDHYIYGLGGYDGTETTGAQTLQEVINELASKPSVGKIDPISDGTGEIFNLYDYVGSYNNSATGPYSHAEGYGTYATGDHSHTEGTHTNASGADSHAEGSSTTASGEDSHAEGTYTTASGSSSHAEGHLTKATAWSSHAEGYCTTASGGCSHAEGYNTNASGHYSHAEGSYTETFEEAEHAEGSYNKSYDSTSTSVRVIHSVGIGTSEDKRKNAHEIKFNGDHYIYGLGGYDGTNYNSARTLQEVINSKENSTEAVGRVDDTSDGTGEIFNSYGGASPNVASGNYSHAEGRGTNATGNYSHAEGYNTTASGENSHAEGYNTTASGENSHAEGRGTNATGARSHAEGNNTTASGHYSHAEGGGTTAEGNYSHAEGFYTSALNLYEHAEGRYNVSNTGDTEDLQTRHSVGIGSSAAARKNAHEIMVNGDQFVYGVGGYDGTNATADTSQTLQAVINSLSTITVDYNQPTTSYTGSDSTTIYKIFDLSSLKYTEGNDIILINGAQRLKYQYAYGETQAATVQVNESTSIEYNLINILSPLITNIFSLEELTIVHGKINAETDEKYYLIIEAVPTV